MWTHKPLHTLLFHRCQIHNFFWQTVEMFMKARLRYCEEFRASRLQCSSKNMAGRLLVLKICLKFKNCSMWEPLVSVHTWIYSCIKWHKHSCTMCTLKQCIPNIWAYIPSSIMLAYDLCGFVACDCSFCLFLLVNVLKRI